MNLYVCRHADRESEQHDSMLSSAGWDHAASLGRAVCSAGTANPYILSSPYGRCLETATAVAHAVGTREILVEYGLSEGPRHVPGTLGPLEGMRQRFPLIDTRYRSFLGEPGGELSQGDVLPRCAEMGRYIAQFAARAHARRDVVVVTHGTVAIGLVAAVASCAARSQLDNLRDLQGCCPAGFYKLHRAPHRATWSCDYVCYSRHLPRHVGLRGTATTPVCRVRAP